MATSASSVTSSGVLTVVSVSGLMVKQTVRLSGTPFGGLLADKTYYITAVGATTITISAVPAGTTLVISGGTGTMVVTPGPRLGPGVDDIITAGSTTLTDPTYGDFNTIQALAAKVYGPPTNGDPRYGYNQVVTSSQVVPGNKIMLSDWINLRTDMIKARGHQTGVASESNNLTLPTDTSKITEAMRLQYFNYATTLTTYRDDVAVSPVPQLEPVTSSTAVRIDDWNGTISSTVTLNWGDLATARGFFNAGGIIKVSVQLTGPFGTAASAKATTWATMFSSMGTVYIDRTKTYLAVGSTGTTVAKGYFDLGSSDTLLFTKTAPSGFYTPNEFTINAKVSAGAVILTMTYNDNDVGLRDGSNNLRTSGVSYVDPLTGQTVTTVVDEYIDGELRQVVALSRPFNYVSIPAPSVAVGGNLTPVTSFVFGMVANKYTINEGDSVEVTLKTQNVPDGTSFQYTVTGITFDRLSAGFLTGSFVVYNNQGTQSWTFDNNLKTDGQTTMTVALNNGQANTVIKINDTSRNPVGATLFSSVGPGQPWVCPAGVRNVSVLIVAGGAGGQSFAGGGGGGGQVRIHNAATQPLQTYYITVGGGGGAGSSGGNSDWNGATAIGGSVGTSGSTTGHTGSHTGGSGGATTGGGSGGNPSGNSGVTMYAAGGGGAGAGGGGSSAPQTYQGGNGGAGYMTTWFNNATIFVGGGGGGGATFQGGGSSFGGGSGSSGNNTGGAGQAGRGGGGGGGGAYPVGAQTTAVLNGAAGGSGGSGLVWIKWS